MAEDSEQLAGGPNDAAVRPRGFLAEEDGFDRRVLWRLASWGFGAVGAVTIAVLANQSSMGWRRDRLASADLTQQSQQIKSLVLDAQTESRRLSSAIDTLNADRDRLYSRVTGLEQGLDSVTGSIARQAPAASPQVPAIPASAAVAQPARSDTAPLPESVSPAKTTDRAPAPPEPTPQAIAPVLSTAPAVAASPAKPAAAVSSDTAPKRVDPADSAAPPAGDVKPAVASADIAANSASRAASGIALQRTDFGIDLGGASSLEGVRALWRTVLKSNKALTALHPIVVVKENTTGLGMQLRLVAGPFADAAAAARTCAALVENNRPCETTVFDGQQLAMKDSEAPVPARPADAQADQKTSASAFGVAVLPGAVAPLRDHAMSVARRAVGDCPPARSHPYSQYEKTPVSADTHIKCNGC